jgi:F0F1-type ATP synthase membrane subunit b/b'
MEKDARKDAGKENSELKQEALSTAETIFDSARGEIASISSQIETEIQTQLKKAHESLQSEAVLLADEIMEKVVGRRI